MSAYTLRHVCARFLLFGFTLFGFTLVSLSAYAANSAEERLDTFLKNVNSFSGDFVQRVLDERGELVQESKGKIKLKKPGKFQWTYEEPFPTQIIGDGKNLWLYDEELLQVTVKPIDEALGSAPIMLLTDLRPIADDFEVEELTREESGDENDFDWVRLTPKVQDTEFHRIDLGMDQRGVREMILHDHFAQRTIVRFQQLDWNTPLNDSVFQFEPPSGVDVIGQPR